MSDVTHIFGPFSLDRSGKVLLRFGVPLDVGQRGIALLKVLVEAQGGAVTKSELMDAGWPDVAVDEGNLTVQIASLRKVLGSDLYGGQWIVTVPRVGYRLAADGQAPVNPLPVRGGTPLIAVLPFANHGNGSGDGYFGDGIVDDIIVALSRFKTFAAVSRGSSFALRDGTDMVRLAAGLGVRYALGRATAQYQGSYRRRARGGPHPCARHPGAVGL